MRTRVMNNMAAAEAVVNYSNAGCISGNNGSVTIPLPAAVIGSFKQISDEITPKYVTRRRKGEVIINPMSLIERITASSNLDLGFTSTCPGGDPNYVVNISGPYFMHLLNGAPPLRELFTQKEVDSYVDIASTKCWADVNVAETQMLVSLIELKRTISLLVNPLSNTIRFLRKVKSTKDSTRFSALTLAQYIAQEWLTYRYGWCNLYRDVAGVLKALAKDEHVGLTQAKGRYYRKREDVVDTSHTPNAPSSYEVYYARTSYSHEVEVRCGLFYDSKLDIERYLGLSKYNVLETAWEVIPFSFVVDWVANVQSYLNALLPLAEVPVRGSYTIVEHKFIVHRACTSIDVSPRSIPPSTIWSVTKTPSGVDTTLERRYSRTLGVKPPRLTVDFKIKDLIDVRVRDALALITMMLSKR